MGITSMARPAPAQPRPTGDGLLGRRDQPAGDVSEALVSLRALNAPEVFFPQPGPSLCRKRTSGTAQQRSDFACSGIQVDGNVVLAIRRHPLQKNSDEARAGKGPRLIGTPPSHRRALTTSDDLTSPPGRGTHPVAKDPIARYASYLWSALRGMILHAAPG
jgi:TPP-dependent pyruvate/acetoin dehydrogenase alpha subunit